MADAAEHRRLRRVGIAGHPYSSLFLPVPVVCFAGTLLTDVAYDSSDGNLLWLNFSSWLIAAGLLFAVLAGVLMIIDLVRLPQLRSAFGWGALGLLLLSAVIEFVNSLVHTRDGWTAVVPTGLILSAIGAVSIASYGWLWHESRYGAGERP